ncbi:MAG: hypothetical protein C0457_06320 [Polymorphum sp.]|nr:hypothetical protein [Polymorphum sp.]
MMDRLLGLLDEASPAKWGLILAFAILGAMMQRDLSIWARLLAIAAGICAAVTFTEPVRDLFHLGPVWGDAVAAALALTGRNWAAFALRASKDPLSTVSAIMGIWRGGPKA